MKLKVYAVVIRLPREAAVQRLSIGLGIGLGVLGHASSRERAHTVADLRDQNCASAIWYPNLNSSPLTVTTRG